MEKEHDKNNVGSSFPQPAKINESKAQNPTSNTGEKLDKTRIKPLPAQINESKAQNTASNVSKKHDAAKVAPLFPKTTRKVNPIFDDIKYGGTEMKVKQVNPPAVTIIEWLLSKIFTPKSKLKKSSATKVEDTGKHP
ncbi:hypothetical protein [Wolbachia endosymbiont of Ctenocephalides felis wCfeT]|uniref:hypothetical protein n=1 Tax=Wolbachia endosymbiont of Ctenocephalides felis wCfeT TaxID=2732593 RepID=UPI0014454B74|nr:hypothetical protein [Wolbachia endosymbiont of Ctenocephalides felis wCfeT]